MVFSARVPIYIALLSASQISAHDAPLSPRNLFKRNIHYAAPADGYAAHPPKGGWNNPDLYKSVFPNGAQGGSPTSSPSPSPSPNNNGYSSSSGGTDYIGSDICGNGGCKSLEEYCWHVQQNGQHDDKCNNIGTGSSNPSSAAGGGGGGSPTTAPASSNTGSSSTGDTSDIPSSGSGTCGKTSATCSGTCAMHIKFSSDSLAVPFTPGDGGTSDYKTTKDSCVCMHGGSVRINIGSTDHTQHTTLIEGNAEGLGQDVSWWDVSYVEGFTYPVVCWQDNNPSRMSGSNVDLYKSGKCTSDGSKTKMGDICQNDGYDPLVRGINCWQCTLPSVFWAPAAGAAYTYPKDDATCASDPPDPKSGLKYASPMMKGGEITCCVGPQCCANSVSSGGLTKKGNCNDACKPCQYGDGKEYPNLPFASCTSACTTKAKRDGGERLLRQESLRKRHLHHKHRDH